MAIHLLVIAFEVRAGIKPSLSQGRWTQAMGLERRAERRKSRRFDVDCPVTLTIRLRGRRREVREGRLLDIGEGGARIRLERSLPLLSRARLDVHFPAAGGTLTNMRFEGVVLRISEFPPCEVTIRFLHRGKILRGGVLEMPGLFEGPAAPLGR